MTATVENPQTATGTATGRVARVIGPVVDVEFPAEAMPEIYFALHVDVTFGEARPRTLTLEVEQHIGDNMVRAISLEPTDGLVRGAEVTNTGAPISVPVGDVTKGHVFNVLGEPLDVPDVVASTSPSGGRSTGWPRRSTSSSPRREMFVTGIKVLDLLTPYVRGGKIGLFGGAGVGKTVLIQEMIRRVAQELRRRLLLRRRGRADPRGQRPVPRDDRVRRHRRHRAGVRPDGRAAGHPAAGRAVRADDGRVLPRRAEAGRAAVHRQHLPVHPGRLRGVHAARPDAVRGGLPADPGRRDGPAAGADHLHPRSLDHLHAGDLRARRRHHRPGPAHGVRAPRRHHRAVPGDHGEGHLPGGGPAGLHVPDPRPAGTSARSTTTWPAPCSRSCSGTRSCRTSSRSWASTSCPRRTRSPCSAPGGSSGSCPSRCTWPSSSPGSRASSSPLDETISSFKAIAEGKYDNVPEQAFYMVGGIEDVEKKAKDMERS